MALPSPAAGTFMVALAVLLIDPPVSSAQRAGGSNALDLADTFALRSVLTQFITSRSPSAVIARLGLVPEDEQIIRAELARYAETDEALHERSDSLARTYVTSRREEDQNARLALEVERAKHRADTHDRSR